MRLIPYDRVNDKCITCKAWLPTKKDVKTGEPIGDCTARPPHIQFLSSPAVDENGQIRGMDIRQLTGFPETKASQSCLEHFRG